MSLFHRLITRSMGALLCLLVLSLSTALAQQSSGTLRGQVVDEQGAVIIGATVTVTNASGVAKTAVTNNEGAYTVGGLAPGKYTVRAQSTGFAVYENAEVEIKAGAREQLNIQLSVTIEEQKVTIASETAVSTEPENNANQVVLRGSDLNSLPDDPDELAAALMALAGPSAGPNGGQIFIDGFTGGRIPPKESIREIRINQNPFSAENDQPGGGRIDILTKPGTDKFRGSAFFNFMDESLNSRNPFSSDRTPYQLRQFGGSLSGPVIPKKASFFIDFERRETDDNEVIVARTLDPSFNIINIAQGVLVPRRNFTFSPRFDYQLNASNTLVARYTYNHFTTENGGVFGINLLSRAINTANTQQTFQLTDTMIVSPTIINETRFQYIRGRSEREGDDTLPGVIVNDAFAGGGAQVGFSFNTEDRWELQNYVSWTMDHHAMKAGARLRNVRVRDVADNNYGGTFIFTSLQQYEDVLRGVAGARPAQFTITTGNAEAKVSQTDLGAFLQDDWRLRPNFTLSMGLRYEAQSNINSWYNLAPRLAFAWSPGAGDSARPPKMVIRGGAGIFYNRFGESNTLLANRFIGSAPQRQFNTFDPQVLANIPFPGLNQPLGDAARSFISTIAVDPSQLITWRVASDLHTPTFYTMGLQMERQLPYKFTMFAGVFNLRISHAIRARDINAPLPGTFIPGVDDGTRPLGDIGEVYQYESSGTFKQKQLFIGVNNRLNPAISIFASYVLAKAENDTDGQGGGLFPANSYDLRGEFGRSFFDVRHRFTMSGNFVLPWYKISLSPFIIATSGRPFNITLGRDLNGDKLFLERPSFAGSNANCALPNIVCSEFGNFNLTPAAGEQSIPRNFGEGPGFFMVNLRVSKTWNFGDMPSGKKAAASSQQGGGDTAGRGAGGGGGRPGGAGGAGGPGGGGRGPAAIPGLGQRGLGGLAGGGAAEKRYGLTFSLQFQNLFNHTNLAPPVGNLSSPFFGESVSLAPSFFFGGGGSVNAGNRRVTAQLRFTF